MEDCSKTSNTIHNIVPIRVIYCNSMNIIKVREDMTRDKYKKAFVEFTHFDRSITIAVVAHGEIVYIGYSIQNPEDKPDKELGRKIAIGRALNNGFDCIELDDFYCYDYGILKSIAYYWKSRFIKYSTLDESTKRLNYDNVRRY